VVHNKSSRGRFCTARAQSWFTSNNYM